MIMNATSSKQVRFDSSRASRSKRMGELSSFSLKIKMNE